MKKTISINIKGFVFNIEEEAYEILQKYIEQLKRIFKNEEGGNEIVDDVEMRIAELFNEKISESYQAITEDDVQEAIDILGAPEDFEASESGYDSNEAQREAEPEDFRNEEKKLYRDGDSKYIGGVCSGIAHYIGWEVLWVRILFLLFIPSGFSIIIYAILYFVVPEAITTAEKLHMKGKKINIENIKKKVSRDFDEAKSAFSAENPSKNYESRLGGALRELLELFGKGLQLLGKVFRKGFGAFILGMGIVLFFLCVFFLVTADSTVFNETGMTLNDFKEIYIHGSDVFWLIVIGASLVVLTMLFILIYNGIRILFDVKHGMRNVNYILISSIVVGIIMLFVGGVSQAKNYSSYEEIKFEVPNELISTDTLYVSLYEDPYFHENMRYNHSEFYDFTRVVDDKIILGLPIQVDFRQSKTDEYTVQLRKTSCGNSTLKALENIENTEYEMELEGNQLRLSPYLRFDKDMRYKGQSVSVVIYVPDSGKVFLHEGMNRIDLDYSDRYLGRYLSYSNDGLR